MPTAAALRATEAVFVEDVCRHRGDDTPRLIFADWLDEHGEGERAEFIRLQTCIAAIEQTCSCAACVRRRGGGQHTNGPCAVDQERDVVDAEGRTRQALLRRRERELLGRTAVMTTRQVFEPEYGWLPEPVRYLFETGPRDGRHDRFWEWRRGFVEEVTLPAEAFAGGPCGRCGGRPRGVRAASGGWATCPACRGTGRTGGHAAALFRAAPVRRVTLSDLDAVRQSDGRYYLVCTHNARVPFAEIVKLMTEADRSSREALLVGLCAACLLYGRRAAWPCPECGGKGRPDRHPFDPDLTCPACGGWGHTVKEG
jgi:uncharacterized protein (TIGR02996 family)